MTRRTEVVGAVVLVMLGAALLFELRHTPEVPVTDPIGPFGLPRIIAGLIIILGLVLVVRAVSAKTVGRQLDTSSANEGGEAIADAPEPGGSMFRTATTIVATVAYVVCLPLLGFVLATALLGLVLLPVLGARKVHVVVMAPLFLSAVLWYVFVEVMSVRLPGLTG